MKVTQPVSGPGFGPWSLPALHLAPLWEVRVRTMEVTSPTCFLLARSQLLWEGRKANAVPIPRMTLGLPEGSAPSLVWGVAAWPWVRLLTPHGFMAPLTHPLGWGGAGLPKVGCIRRLLLSGLPGTKPALLCPEVRIESARSQAQVDHRGVLGSSAEGEQEATLYHSRRGC